MDINFSDLEKLIKLAERSDIHSLEVTDGDARIAITCHSNSNGSDNQMVNHTSHISGQHLKASSGSSSKQRTATNADDHIGAKSTDEAPPAEDLNNQVSAPMLGTFYRRSEPTVDEFVNVGDQVNAGQTLCIIEAMKMMHEVKADIACTIKEVLVDEGDVVEYGEPLFIIKPNS